MTPAEILEHDGAPHIAYHINSKKTSRTLVIQKFRGMLALPSQGGPITTPWGRRILPTALLTLSLFALFFDNINLPAPDVRRALKRAKVDEAKIRHLRIAALGTSITWGSSLPNPLTQAYPHLLSPDANNAALRATGPNYPAICTPSLLGVDSMYDVIVLQYYQRASEGLAPLARRVRKRFPDAIIVVTRIWHPRQIKNLKNGGDIRDWANGREFHSDEFLTAFLETDEEEWDVFSFDPEKELQDAILEEIGGYLYEMPFPEENPKEAIRRYRNWFSEDFHHLSPEGHEEVARGIREILKQATEKYDPETAQLGMWGENEEDGGLESCHSWFESGEVTIPYSPNAKLNMFDDRGKYALEIPYEGASITINNPNEEEPRTLHLAFMSNAPAPSLYPKATVYINGVKSAKTLEQPNYMKFEHPVHVPVTVEVGELKPGDNEVKIVPSHDEVTEKLFRLTGAVIGPRNK